MNKTPTTLIIMDGFGLRTETEGNAVAAANTPRLDQFFQEYAHTELSASGLDVGLPAGQMGNSEVGHTNIGAGRVVFQDLPRISKSIDDGDFFQNPAYVHAMDACKEKRSALHLMGLLSDGGVHSHIDHLFALMQMAKDRGLERVYIHAFLDGRDVSPTSGADYVTRTVEKCRELGVGKIATLMGRYYAMDRDKRWDRVEAAYDAMVYGESAHVNPLPVAAVKDAYAAGVTDEFIEPVICDGDGTISDNDSVIFFNGGVETQFPGEDRVLVPSPKVATYDLQPEMSAYEVCDKCVERIESGAYDVIILNFANCDMVGHTGVFDAAVKAVETVDECVGKVVDATMKMGGIAMITADHGNAETMTQEDGSPMTAHTTDLVPFILCGAGSELRQGRLADIAPTILDVMGLAVPEEMDGQTLIVK